MAAQLLLLASRILVVPVQPPVSHYELPSLFHVKYAQGGT